jgi:acyl carrier protein phosphodiesterase
MVTGTEPMTSIEHMTDEQFERYALEVLQRELGPDGLARFLRLNRSGKGNYTRDWARSQRSLSVAEIVASLNRMAERSPQLRVVALSISEKNKGR